MDVCFFENTPYFNTHLQGETRKEDSVVDGLFNEDFFQQNPNLFYQSFEKNSGSFFQIRDGSIQANSEIGNQEENLVSNLQENSVLEKFDQENLQQNAILENNSNFEIFLGSDESGRVLS